VKLLLSAALTLCLSALPLVAARNEAGTGQGAILRALDKVNGRTTDVQLRSGDTAQMMGLSVHLRDCRFPTENPTGDAFAFLTITEPDTNKTRFQGWMIASSPALNALDHSRYDIWVIRCITS
jgi:hypothetical protein